MGAWYWVNGRTKVRDCPEVRELIDNELAVASILEEKDGVLEIAFDHAEYSSYEHIGYIDSTIEEFSAYVLEPTLIPTQCDDEKGWLYLGPEEQREDTESANLLSEILYQTSQLTKADRRRLIEHLEKELSEPQSP